MFASVFSCFHHGLEGRVVDVQVDICPGQPAFQLVGLAAATVKEARDRVRAAIRNSDFKFPAQRLTVNLAPAELRKEGTGFDLAIAVGIVLAYIGRRSPDHSAFIGELALDGAVRHVNGVLVAARALGAAGFRRVFVSEADAAEAALVPGLAVYRCPTLAAVIGHLLGEEPLATEPPGRHEPEAVPASDDLVEVQGQDAARRALEVAAAGAHHLLLSGPPGSGKTMLARCLPSILPPLTLDEALEVAQIRSVVGDLTEGRPLEWIRPFRAPHHNISTPGLVGGGTGVPRPGEITRAHNGVLFLDELAEFSPSALQSLRQPLEEARVGITRTGGSVSYPSHFQLVAATNPCPCGWLGDSQHACRCNEGSLASYVKAVSGPLLDRIDLRVTVSRPRLEVLSSAPSGETSGQVRERVRRARAKQLARQGKLNSALKPRELRQHAALGSEAKLALQRWASQRGFTARAFHRAWRVALTLADLEGAGEAAEHHVLEALGYRLRDEVA